MLFGASVVILVLVWRRLSSAQARVRYALRDNDERTRLLVKASPVPMAVQRGGRWVLVNDAGLELVGARTGAEIIGKPVFYFVARDRIRALKERIRRRVPASPEAMVFRERIFCLDGSSKEAEIAAIPIVYGGQAAGQVIASDISHQGDLSGELARAQRLELAGRLAGQIAHDFNNLLAPLTAYPTLMREALPADHPVLDFINEIESTAHRIAEINQQLLALGRRGHHSFEAIDLNKLLEKVLLTQSMPSTVEVKMELSPELFHINGGMAQLHRTLVNLIANAKEAMRDRGVLTIKTQNCYVEDKLNGYGTINPGEYVRLEISDTGTGIQPEMLEKIFEPFFTTKKMDKYRGSGLGLSVVQGIVEDHGGGISVASEVGKGTRFSLYFPIARREPVEHLEKAKMPAGHGERLLVVDDDPVQRKVARQLLEWLGYTVHLAASGEEAVTHLRSHDEDLLLLDMVMPGIDGAETYRQVLEFNARQKAIILSSYAMSPRLNYALRLGAGAFVPKPIIPQALADAVRNVLDRDEVAN